MEFLAMIGVGILGLCACGRLFGLLFKLMGKGFDELEDSVMNIGHTRRRTRFFDDDDDD